MTIATISQDIGRIINLRREAPNNPTPDEGWYIDGLRWTGDVVTVGTGKQYSTIESAIGNRTTDCLCLLYPGTYNAKSWAGQGAANIFLRGMGSDATKTIVAGYIAQGGASLWIENISMSTGIWTYANLMTSGVTNKCIIGAVGGGTHIAPGNAASDVIIQYTTVYPGPLGHTWLCNKAAYRLYKVAYYMFYGGWEDYYPTGTWAFDDKQVIGTSGYGYDSGSFLIKQGAPTPDLLSISQPIGRVINLKRNVNNVPLPTMAGNPGDLASISQPIGKIIRLRRNTSNVPGD